MLQILALILATFAFAPLDMASSSLDAPAGVIRPIVFFDVSIGETHAGRIKMGQLVFSSLKRLADLRLQSCLAI